MGLCNNSQPVEKNPFYMQVPVIYYAEALCQCTGLTKLRIGWQIVSSAIWPKIMILKS